MHQSAIVLVRCVPGSSLLLPPYWKARRPWERGCILGDLQRGWDEMKETVARRENLSTNDKALRYVVPISTTEIVFEFVIMTTS